MQIPDIAHFKSGLYLLLLNNKEFRFFLLGLNSIFSTLSQSEYTSREVYSGLCLYLSIVYSLFQRCPTRDEISFPALFIIFQDYLNLKILKFFENFEILYEFFLKKYKF
jgi:hypothetical protein